MSIWDNAATYRCGYIYGRVLPVESDQRRRFWVEAIDPLL